MNEPASVDPTPSRAPSLPPSRRLLVSNAGILTFGRGGAEELEIDDQPPAVGRAVCVVSGGRFAFRRVLEVRGTRLRLRADIAPFEDAWDDAIVGCVVPRFVDRVVATDPKRVTRASWHAAMAYAKARAARRFLSRPKPVAYRTALLATEDWPDVRAFWRYACGDDLPVLAQPHQHVIGLYEERGEALVGANIYLGFGKTAFSAFTLVDPRFRGTGGGNAMLAHAVREAKRRGFESMYVHIDARNLPSIAAYRRAGFVRRDWWSDASDPLAAAERQWIVFEREFG